MSQLLCNHTRSLVEVNEEDCSLVSVTADLKNVRLQLFVGAKTDAFMVTSNSQLSCGGSYIHARTPQRNYTIRMTMRWSVITGHQQRFQTILNAFHSVSSAKNRVSATLDVPKQHLEVCWCACSWAASLSTAVIVQTTIQNTRSTKSISE